MGKDTKIEWAHHTFNPWWGCTKVSEACRHCYAESMAKRTGHAVWGENAERRPLSDNNWRQPLKWDRSARKRGVIERVFCASMSDVFEGRADLDEHRARLWGLIRQTTNLRWLLLTKRPENIQAMLPADLHGDRRIWLGTTVESQDHLEARLDALQSVAHSYARFVSAEPLLGPLDFGGRMPALSWVIAGGESGGGARPMHPRWVRSIRDQCVAAGVPFLFKQWGAWVHDEEPVPSQLTQTIDGYQFHRVGKKNAGRILDGRTWDQVPAE